MGTIIPFLRDGVGLRDSVFDPHEITAMSMALDDVCKVLKLQHDSSQAKLCLQMAHQASDDKVAENLKAAAANYFSRAAEAESQILTASQTTSPRQS